MITIFYDMIEDKEHYLELLEKILSSGKSVNFDMNGITVMLNPGMRAKEIKKHIEEKIENYETKNIYVEIDKKESLLTFAKRISSMANENNTCYYTKYRNKIVKASPGCEAYKILYQINNINIEYVKSLPDGFDYIEASTGMDYIEFGINIYKRLINGRAIIGRLNNIEIAFTPDMTEGVRFGDFPIRHRFDSTNAFVFSQMFNVIGNIRNNYYKI